VLRASRGKGTPHISGYKAIYLTSQMLGYKKPPKIPQNVGKMK
jgi:hypothetical protein